MQSVRALAAACLLVLVSISFPVQASSKSDVSRQIRFGAEMARQGNWREAIFRWQRALKLDPDNPRIHNDLAVAHESLGEYDKADTEYRAALAAPDAPREIKENHELFLKFYTRFKEGSSSSPGPPRREGKKPDETGSGGSGGNVQP